MFQSALLCCAVTLAQPPAKAPAKYAVPWYVPAPARDMDAVKMYFAIKSGSMMGPGEGWFGPAQQRHTWDWLAAQHKIEKDEAIAKDKFRGPPELFARLDRDGDGVIKKGDFDWTNASEYVRQLSEARWWTGRNDADDDSRLSKAEWDKIFEKANAGKGFLSPEDVRAVLFPPVPPRSGGFNPGDRPSKAKLFQGLFTAEIGSPFPGPDVGAAAPDFTLPTADGKQQVTLSEFGKGKPVVLIFGSFT